MFSSRSPPYTQSYFRGAGNSADRNLKLLEVHILKIFSKLMIVLLLGASSGAFAAGVEDAGPSTSAAKTAMSDGEIKKIDREAAKLTIKHGELKNLGMPGMTMVFRVQPATMIDQVKVGDKVRFVAEKVAGALTVTSLEVPK